MFNFAFLLGSLSISLLLCRVNAAAFARIPSEAYVEVGTDPDGIIWPWRVFKSSPHTPPNLEITGNGGELAPGYIFMTPQTINTTVPAAEQNGGFIVTSDNELVYALNISGITDFRKESWNGADYLVYWSGDNTEGLNVGHGYGQANFLDTTYKSSIVDPNLGLNKLMQTTEGNWSIDIHEQQMTPRNTLLVSAYSNRHYDLSSLGGSENGWIVDSHIYELDMETWEVLFSWKAIDHVPISASHQPLKNGDDNFGTKAAPWDWFHVNAVDLVGEDYLINGRHTWSTYLVSGKDGSVVWHIEGEDGGSFGALPSDGTFKWQHFARAHNVTATGLDLSLFDNHNSGLDNGTGPSTGLVYHLELPASKSYTPQLLRKIETPSEAIYAESQGSFDPALVNGNQLVGYGQISMTREYGPATDGSDLRWQAQFGGENAVQSYRAFKDTWSATPADWDPSLVVEGGKAYVSWNGATDITAWNVYTTSSSGAVAKQVARKKGFETVFKVSENAKTIQVGAVRKGKEVRKSNAVILR